MLPRVAVILLVASAAARAQSPSAGAPATRPAAPVRTGRIVGVFDDATGSPVAGAEVVDLITGWSASTTPTGTVSLFYVDTGGTLLRIRKLGYVPQTFPVKNSDRDTIPITIVLKPSAQMLPAAVTKARSARGPADTVRKLDLAGFYDRRNTQGAPVNAFITAERIEHFNLLTDAGRLTGIGRGYCYANLYIDGVKVEVPDLNFGGARTTKLRKNGIDALLDPGMVAAIEFYSTADTPAQYNPTNNSSCGATLIWTK